MYRIQSAAPSAFEKDKDVSLGKRFIIQKSYRVMEIFSPVHVTAADVAVAHSSVAPRGNSGNSLLCSDALKYNAVGKEEEV